MAEQTFKTQFIGVDGAYIATSAAADVGSFYLPERATIVEIGMVPIVNAGSNNVIADFDRRVTPGSDTGRGAADVGQIETLASPVVGTAIRRFVDFQTDPHEEIVVQISNAGAASSTAIFYIKYKDGGRGAVDAGEVDPV